MVSNIFYFHPYLGKIPNLTNIFQMGWNHQLEGDEDLETHQRRTRVMVAWSASVWFLSRMNQWTNLSVYYSGDRWYLVGIVEGNVYLIYKWYVLPIGWLHICILPTTLYKNLKNPLNLEWDPLPPKMDEFEVYFQGRSLGQKTPQRIGIWVWWI